MSLSSSRQPCRKKPPFIQRELPTKAISALALAAGGMTFEQAAAEVDMNSDASGNGESILTRNHF